ncbi:type IV pilus assembly protein PilM [Salinibacillus kushneri]|uniref:Type IV pilus assembly protein PilM n=1 Tax=Salinibacillus kushneri TaxID=237682 RepID=A0A1I0GMG1_9BACI|nr:pilus assembly protein PilM [Salinibacillus kushneri]SET72154.1 type IV pilus assembly protein PilM [Salinibacillus kushneri]
MALGQIRTINIEIQDYVIRCAEVKKKQSFVVTYCDEYYFPTGIVENGEIINQEAFVKTLKYCVRKWKMKRKNVRFIVPDSSVIIKTVQVPAAIEDEEITGHVYFELGHSIHLPFEDPVIDTVLLEKNESQKQVLLVASAATAVDSYHDYFKAEKATPIAADVSALCQYRLFHHYGITNDDDTFMLVQFNVKSVTVSIFEHHQPVFLQHIEIHYQEDTWKVVPLNQGGQLSREQFDEEKVKNALEEIYTELERILRFYQYSLNNGDKQINHLMLTGDHPFLTDILEGVQERLEVPAHLLSPRTIPAAKGVPLGYAFYNVIGLAMKEGV